MLKIITKCIKKSRSKEFVKIELKFFVETFYKVGPSDKFISRINDVRKIFKLRKLTIFSKLSQSKLCGLKIYVVSYLSILLREHANCMFLKSTTFKININ